MGPKRRVSGPALGHHLDRQAALEVGRRALPLLELGGLAAEQGCDESLVLGLVERAVDVVGTFALVVARLEPGLGEVDRVLVDDRRDGIEEGQVILAGQFADRLAERRRGQRAGRQDDRVPVVRRRAA